MDEVERMATGRHVNYAAAEARTGASDCAALRDTTRSRRTKSLGGARAQRGEARTAMDLRRRGGAGAGSEQEKRGGGG